MRRDLIHQIEAELRDYGIKVDCDKLQVFSQYSDDDIERVLDAFRRRPNI